MVLEQGVASASCFLTLTYADEHLPYGGSLSREHLRNFFKREVYYGGPVRYYACGEYGDRTQRAHYHAALFGRDFGYGMVKLPSWTLGHAFSARLELASMAYIAAYINNRRRKGGRTVDVVDPETGEVFKRESEFAVSSMRPGIGGASLGAHKRFLESESGLEFCRGRGDVPREIRFGGKVYPCGRYVAEKLREFVSEVPRLSALVTRASIRDQAFMRQEAQDEQKRASRREVYRIRAERISQKGRKVIG